MKRWHPNTAAVVTLGLVFAVARADAQGAAKSITFPANAGALNVRDAPFGARGDGKTDDTQAIQKALTAALGTHRIVYLPNGTYLVSDTLRWQNAANAGDKVQGWGPFLQLQGQSRAATIIKLKDNAPGFGDEQSPKAIVQTGSSGSHGDKRYSNGEGNEAFENHIRDLTVDAGSGNAGAVGIDYQVSNCGALRGVTIRSSNPQRAGFCGLNLTRRDNGPGLIKDVTIEGFRFGIRTAQEIAHFTFEDITLRGQRECGLWMRDAVVAARKIRSRNSVPAIKISGVALLSLFDSYFAGGATQTPGAAIECEGAEARLYIRNLQTSGYTGSVRHQDALQKPLLAEWSPTAPLGNAPLGAALSLRLPIRETPEWSDPDISQWADAGAPSANDDTRQIQAALDAGRSTVYFRHGRYHIADTLTVPPGVRRMVGIGAELTAIGAWPDGKPLFRLTNGKAADLTAIDRLAMGGSLGRNALFEHSDGRTLVLRDIIGFGGSAYRNRVGAGPLFIEDVALSGYYFAPGTQVWARQWNAEGSVSPKVVNDGGTVWALGSKHESGETIFENKNGGRMEIWSAFAYTFGTDPQTPALINTDSSLAFSLAGTTFMGPGGFFDLLVRDTQNGATTELRRGALIARGGGAFVPLYRSVSAPTAKTVAKTLPQKPAAKR